MARETPAMAGIFNSLDMMAVCESNEPFSLMIPAAWARRNTQPGSVEVVTNILPLVSYCCEGSVMISTSARAFPEEQGIPCNGRLSGEADEQQLSPARVLFRIRPSKTIRL